MPFDESATVRTDFSLEEILAEFREPAASDYNPSPPAVSADDVMEPAQEESSEQLPPVEDAPVDSSPADSVEHAAGEANLDDVADDSFKSTATPVKKRSNEKKPRKRDLFYRLKGKLVSDITVKAYERRQRLLERRERRTIEEPDVDAGTSASLYSYQYSALYRRTQLAFLVTLLPLWITLGFYTSFPLPEGLKQNPAAASLVCLCALITIMMIALDVVTEGVLSVLYGTPGTETLTVLSALIVSVHLILTVADTGLQELPPALLPCVAFSLLLLSNTMTCRTRRISLRAFAKNKQPYTVTSERLLGREEAFLIKTGHAPVSFLRRSEEPDRSETMAMSLFTPVTLISVAVSAAAGILKGSLGELIRTLSYLSCVWVGWGSLFSLSFITLTLTRRLKREGSVVAGWTGIQDAGRAAHLILTDSDLFPAGTASINGVKILKGFFTDKVTSYTTSFLVKANIGIAPLFLDLIGRNGGEVLEIEDFKVEEGGLSGFIDGEKILVGCAGYMHLQGIKVPARFLGGSAVFTAINDTLVSRFGIEYRPDPSVTQAIHSLRNSQRKPIFAVRDFNIDPLLIKEKFRCSSDEFEFPPMAERYEISSLPETGNSEASGIILSGGLDSLTAISSGCRTANILGSACSVFSFLSTVLGILLVTVSVFAASAVSLTPLFLLLFLGFWMIPLLFFLPELRN